MTDYTIIKSMRKEARAAGSGPRRVVSMRLSDVEIDEVAALKKMTGLGLGDLFAVFLLSTERDTFLVEECAELESTL